MQLFHANLTFFPPSVLMNINMNAREYSKKIGIINPMKTLEEDLNLSNWDIFKFQNIIKYIIVSVNLLILNYGI